MVTKNITKQHVARLPLEGITNCRELGGYATNEMKVTKWHNLLRSNTFTNATEEDLQFLLEYGVNTIIDLRTKSEIKKNPNPANKHSDFNYINVDLIGQGEDGLMSFDYDDVDIDEMSLGRSYVNMITTNDRLKQVFDIMLTELEHGGALFHCTAGKDRTGVIAMLLLGLGGVSKQDIIANYQVTHTYIENQITDFSDYGLDEEALIKMRHLGTSNPANITLAYDTVMEEFGSFIGYFENLGYSEIEITKLKNSILQ